MAAIRNATSTVLTILTGFYGLLHFTLLHNYGAITNIHLLNADDVVPSARKSNRLDIKPSANRSLMDLLERSPSVDYFSCCGAGHRFSKMSDSYYLAKQIGFGLRIFFGFCDDQEVFSHFFGPQPVDEAIRMTSRWNGTKDHLHLKISNENPGFTKLIRTGNNSTCRCDEDRLQSDVEFYGGIRDRFRNREKVEAFVKEYFTDRTVIGIHIRAGNGENGDFERKNRTIPNVDEWSASMSRLLQGLSQNFTDPPLLFIATDTAHIISNFKTLLRDVMPMIHYSQDRLNYGDGVLFGARGKVEDAGEKCLNGWSDSFTDMMILSHADVVVAGRPSSFTQSLPMTLALAKQKQSRKVSANFCEVNPSASKLKCYVSLVDWCCNGNTDFSLQGIQRYDYRRMPRIPGIDPKDFAHHIHERPKGSTACIPKPMRGQECLPYKMPDPNALKKATEEEMRLHRLRMWKEERKDQMTVNLD